MKNNAINIISFLLILLWIYAAASKLAEYDMFISQLSRQPLPPWSIPILVWLLPAIELFTALLLAFRKTRSYGLLFSFVLLLTFTFYTALALSGAYGSIPCSCGGVFSFMGWKAHFIFNTVASLIAFSGWYLSKTNFKLTINHTRKYYVHKREVS